MTVDNIASGVRILLNEGGQNVEIDTSSGVVNKNIEEILSNHRRDPLRFPAEQASADIRGIVLHAI